MFFLSVQVVAARLSYNFFLLIFNDIIFSIKIESIGFCMFFGTRAKITIITNTNATRHIGSIRLGLVNLMNPWMENAFSYYYSILFDYEPFA